MADIESLLSDILEEARDASKSLADLASSGGSVGGGTGGLPGLKAGGGGAGGGFGDLLGGLAKKGGGKLATNAIAARAVGAIGGVAGAGIAMAAQEVGDAVGAGAKAGAQSFLTSGGNTAAAGGSFQRAAAGAIGGGFVGEVLGLNAAERVASQSENSLRGVVEAAAREGSPLSRKQIAGLADQAYKREGRAEDARRVLGEEINSRFGKELEGQFDDATGRAAQALESVATQLGRLLDGRSLS